jgi:DNA-binding MarR family transcriptional regulator
MNINTISNIANRDLRYILYLCFMRKHNGMRPQDIVILLAIISYGKKDWLMKDLAISLYISQSEVSESLHRSQVAGLIDYNKHRVNRNALYEFLEFGLAYVFPVQPGPVASGMPTAHSHPAFKNKIISEQFYVWPEPGGSVRGFTVEPLYNKQAKAVKENSELYKLLAMVDVLRVGNRREIKFAKDILAKSILHESSAEHQQN